MIFARRSSTCRCCGHDERPLAERLAELRASIAVRHDGEASNRPAAVQQMTDQGIAFALTRLADNAEGVPDEVWNAVLTEAARRLRNRHHP